VAGKRPSYQPGSGTASRSAPFTRGRGTESGSATNRRRIGIFGGTFNPVHTGHLILAQDAMEALRLDEVRFIPCATPPHKPAPDLAPARDRLAMLRLALRDHTGFVLDDLEIHRGAPSYSVDTLAALRCRQPNARYYFIIGADSLPDLPRWYQADRLRKLATFAVVPRPGFPLPATPRGWRVRVVAGHACEIASRDIRRRVAASKTIRHLVPANVCRYIQRHKLYLGTKGD
jgi:nicotinate-nucleotide adenylyltransferase